MAQNVVSQVANTKVSADFTIGQAFGVAIAKNVSEQALARVPFVGNATLRSSLIKMGLALTVYNGAKSSGLPKLVKSTMNVTSTGLIVDATEDLVTSTIMPFVSRFTNKGSNDIEDNIETI